MNTATSSLPGFHAPGAGFEAPFDMLSACHDRVRRSLDLLQRLVAHLRDKGADAMARDAARDVLRYFDIAAPAHHEDEERHLLPRLRASADAQLQAAATQMEHEHALFRECWGVLRPLLFAVRQAQDFDLDDLDAAAQRFIDIHGPHLALEDTFVFPRMRALVEPDTTALAAMGGEMAGRRRPG